MNQQESPDVLSIMINKESGGGVGLPAVSASKPNQALESGTFGCLLRARRRALDLTQEELAKRVRYSVITIRKVESGERRPSRELAEHLARVLDVSADERPAFIATARSESAWLPTQTYRGPQSPPAVGAPGALPTPLTRLIGREGEVSAILRMLVRDDVRLVTLVGPPGIGKSRLGVRVADCVRTAALAATVNRFPDGVYYAPLAPIGDPALIAPSIATALGVSEAAGWTLPDRLVGQLRDQRVLLVLDDFDHLLDAAPFVAELLTACAGLKVLATSRSPLHLRGERLHLVPPLGVPRHVDDLTAERVLDFPAVELFADRACDADPGFTVADSNAADIASLCFHLDGLPLAIELVAARARTMAPADLVARLGDRLALLTDGPLDLPARQQTMRRTIDWSHDLLDPPSQRLFARLSVFVGGCSLRAAEDVAGDTLGMPVIDGMSALVNKNLVGQESRLDGERHYVLLETIREYAQHRLVASGEERAIRDRHAACFLKLAEQANTDLTGHQLDRLEATQDNIRAAIDWYIETGMTEASLRLVAALWKFWHIRSRQTEGKRWISLALAADSMGHDHLRAQVLHGAGWLALDGRDQEQAYQYFDESLAIFRRLDDAPGIAEALHGVGICAQARDDHAGAACLYRESLDLHRSLGNDEGVAWSLDHLGDAMLNMADHHRAEAMFGESLAIFRRLQHAWGTAISLHHQALAALARLDTSLAEERLAESLMLFSDLDNTWGVASSHDHLGYAALVREAYSQAREHFVTALLRNRIDQDRDGFARSLTGLGSVAARQRCPELAARLFGAAEFLAEGSGIGMNKFALRLYERDEAAVRSELGCEAFDQEKSIGRAMSLDQLVELAAA
jgi:predicted ATPase/transcriptional regulator with XRE-family HTH domain